MTRDIRKDLFSFEFFKKSPFFGSCGNLRYRIGREKGSEGEEDTLTACIYPGPYSFEFTPDEEKKYKSFEFSPDGMEQAASWVQKQVDEMQEQIGK